VANGASDEKILETKVERSSGVPSDLVTKTWKIIKS